MKGGGRGDPPGCPEVCTGLASKQAKLWQKNLQGRLVQKLRCQGSTGAVPGVVPAPRRASGEHPGLVSTAGGALGETNLWVPRSAAPLLSHCLDFSLHCVLPSLPLHFKLI